MTKNKKAPFGSLEWAFDQMSEQWGDDPILGEFFPRRDSDTRPKDGDKGTLGSTRE